MVIYFEKKMERLHSGLQLSRSDVEKNARRCRWRKSHSKIEVDDEFGLAMQRKESWRACLNCFRQPGENQMWKSESTSELVEWAAAKNGETCNGRLLIKLLRMEQWWQVVFSSETNRCITVFNVRVDLQDVHRHFFCTVSFVFVAGFVDSR